MNHVDVGQRSMKIIILLDFISQILAMIVFVLLLLMVSYTL
jgi:hypothetical protein